MNQKEKYSLTHKLDLKLFYSATILFREIDVNRFYIDYGNGCWSDESNTSPEKDLTKISRLIPLSANRAVVSWPRRFRLNEPFSILMPTTRCNFARTAGSGKKDSKSGQGKHQHRYQLAKNFWTLNLAHLRIAI